ncbi:hypothetical protein [Desulfoluna spongiiphila]|nr:hypothetical protein [Desulfoluna spongiiphila]
MSGSSLGELSWLSLLIDDPMAGGTMFSYTRAARQSVDNDKDSGLLKRAFGTRPDTDNSKRVSVYDIGDERHRQFQGIDGTAKAIQKPSAIKAGIGFNVGRS